MPKGRKEAREREKGDGDAGNHASARVPRVSEDLWQRLRVPACLASPDMCAGSRNFYQLYTG